MKKKIIEKKIPCKCADNNSAISLLFASYNVFNIPYPEKEASKIVFFQKALFKIEGGWKKKRDKRSKNHLFIINVKKRTKTSKNKIWTLNIENMYLYFYQYMDHFPHVLYVFFSHLIIESLILECLYWDRKFRYRWAKKYLGDLPK